MAMITVDSNSASDIQTAVDAAVSGDVVQLLSGTAALGGTVTLATANHITIQGAGTLATILTCTTTAFNMRSGSRLTNIKFQFPDTAGTIVGARGQGWRIDNCYFDNTGTNSVRALTAEGSSYYGWPTGLFDNNYCDECRVVANADTALLANTIWSEPLGLGSANFVFVEDCEFVRTHGNAVDSQYGGRYVFRHNTLTGAYIEAHGVQDYDRGTRAFEVYENTITAITATHYFVPFSFRGGTGVVYNNTISGYLDSGGIINNAIRVDNVRSFSPNVVTYGFEWGYADGTKPVDENSATRGASGYPSAWPVRDQIGRSTDIGTWDEEADPYNTQSWMPMAAWGNVNEYDDPIPIIVSPDMSDEAYNGETMHIMGKDEFDTTVDFTYDPADESNNTTTALSGQYDFQNEQLTGYVAYTYPHPLQTTGLWDETGGGEGVPTPSNDLPTTYDSYYYDTDASGANDGSSWTDAWQSLSAVEAGLPGTLTENAVVFFRASAGTADTTAVTFNYTGNQANSKEVHFYPDTDQGAIKTSFDTNRYRLSALCTFSGADNIHFWYMQFTHATGYQYGFAANYAGSAMDLYFHGCRGYSATANAGGINCNHANYTLHLENCILDFNLRGFRCQAGSATVYNSVLWGGSDGALFDSGTAGTMTNCALGNNTDDVDDQSSGGWTIDHNASDDGDGTNTVAPASSSWANEFSNPTTKDFTLLNTGNLYHAGTPVTGVDYDIDGDAWNASTPSIGADEYASAPTYPLAYDGNGSDSGTAPTDGSSPYADGATVTVLGPGDLAKTGEVFVEWNTAQNGSGTAYSEDDTFSMPASNVTLYAQWTVASEGEVASRSGAIMVISAMVKGEYSLLD